MLRTLLSEKKNLRLAAAVELYKREELSLGEAHGDGDELRDDRGHDDEIRLFQMVGRTGLVSLVCE